MLMGCKRPALLKGTHQFYFYKGDLILENVGSLKHIYDFFLTN